ncbi:hypothetical protein Z969_00180 [Clostridium novyi A str. 4570]|uniref:Flagellin lysine-N-methylase n=1 Tax=Clostridium novyi A str. 4570 TaxID=1444290 RepID=A0AA89CTK8_CLONO|nr:flagellin lysine-N-methylase [Clostridium novyi]KGN03424.1 hypothetical protein Z969_00180 [Clostridium novyi A str. 4570]
MKKIIKQPIYYSNFVCNGSTCDENCCGRWNIWIDKKHYKELRKLKDKDIKYKINKYIKRYKNTDTSYDHYAEMGLESTGKCPFLTKEKLCEIQIKYGFDILPNVCKIYPRKLNKIFNTVERSLDISCPTAAEIILMNREGIKFQELEDEYIYNNTFSYVYDKKINYEILMDIRTFCIQIMKSRDYKIWERLIILGIFIGNMDELFTNDKFDNSIIEKNINEVKQLIVSGDMKEYLKSINSNTDFKIKITKEILDEIFYMDNHIDAKNRYIQCFF